MSNDIIAMIYRGDISLEEAERLFDNTIERIHLGINQPEWWKTLGLTNYEATAVVQGAGLADVIKLRYEGWPVVCCRCKLPIDYRLYGWWFEAGDKETPCIRHVECPESL